MGESLRGIELVTTSGTSQLFTHVMVQGVQYYLTCSKACWYKVGTAGVTAAASSGSQYAPADTPMPIGLTDSGDTRVAVIWASEAGSAVLSAIGAID